MKTERGNGTDPTTTCPDCGALMRPVYSPGEFTTMTRVCLVCAHQPRKRQQPLWREIRDAYEADNTD